MKKTARRCTRVLAYGVLHSTDFRAWSMAKRMRRLFVWIRLSITRMSTLLTGAYVKRLETDASGRVVTKVLVEREGQPEEYSADIVVVSCGAINSAALLLRSTNDKHPNGLANSSDVVGRHYMRHNNSAFMAISKQPNPTVFQKTLGLNDFYFRSDDWEYPLGGIQMLGKTDGEMLKGEAPGWAVWKPGFALDYMAEHSIDFWVQSEDLPHPDNRVTLNPDGRDHTNVARD